MRKILSTLSILILLALVAGVAGAQAPEASWEAALANAVPGPTEGVRFVAEKVASGVETSPEALNIYPYLAYTAAAGNEFYEPPVTSFTVGVGEMWMNDYFVVINHATTGMKVLHLLVNQSGGQNWYYLQDVPTWTGNPGEQWRFAVYFYTVPDMPGTYLYLPITLPYDGDGYKLGKKSVFGPVTIHY